jgi:hypothetical protein
MVFQFWYDWTQRNLANLIVAPSFTLSAVAVISIRFQKQKFHFVVEKKTVLALAAC